MATKEQDKPKETWKFGDKKYGAKDAVKPEKKARNELKFEKKAGDDNDDDKTKSSHQEVDVTNKSDNQTSRDITEKLASQVKINTPPKSSQQDRRQRKTPEESKRTIKASKKELELEKKNKVATAGDDYADTKSSKQDVKREKSQPENSEESKKTKASEKEELEGHGLWAFFVYSTILLVTVLAIIIALVGVPEEPKPYILAKGFKEKMFNNSLKEMKMQFPNQTLRFWTILEKRVLAHLKNKQPTQPLVILMGAPPSAHSVIDCMAKKLVQTLDPVNYNLGYIDCTRLTNYSSDEAKELLDEKLESLFRKGDRTALILHLELLPPPSPFLFYSYCDTENAPFKKAGIIFTVHLPEEPDLSLLPVDRDGMIERNLAEAVWSKFDDQDGVSALLSQIADTVTLVSGEAEEVVKLNCPNTSLLNL